MRSAIKSLLARLADGEPARGITVLIYHRIGGGSPDERDLSTEMFGQQLDVLERHGVVHLDDAVQRLQSGDDSPGVVLTFDDGFRDVFEHGWPLLRERGMPFTLYLATRFLGGTMHWDGSTARAAGPALSWEQVAEMVGSGLCTPANHTHSHVVPEQLSAAELDRCSELISARLGVRPRHFAFPWGVPVPQLADELSSRFTTAATGRLGRVLPGDDLLSLPRIPVRQSDPLPFFVAKLGGRLRPERAYAQLVAVAKKAGVHG